MTEGFTEIDFGAVADIFGEALQQALEGARAWPELEASVALFDTGG